MNLQKISSYMCLILRHKPEAIGITIDEHGWVNIQDLINGISEKNPGFNREILDKIVETDKKNRYSISSDGFLIRANQGHSIPVDVELEEKEPPEYLYHGTGEKYVESIDKIGLIPKSRLYVHLSYDGKTAKNVGERHGKAVIYHVKSGEMYKDGYKFYLSVNGVWLTKRVPVKYLEKVKAIKPNKYMNEPVEHDWTTEDVIKSYQKINDKRAVAAIYDIPLSEVTRILKKMN